MQGFVTEIDANAAKGAEEAAAGGNGDFPPLPQGKYQVTIAKVKGVSDFARAGANAGKKVVDIGFQIVPESPRGKGRYIWGRVPLFSRFAPSEKNPEGAVNRGFWDFWEKAMGVSRESILAGEPLPSNIGGRRLTVTLGAPIPPDDYNPLGSNEISFFDKEGDVSTTPMTPLNVPWLDADGKRIAFAGAPAAPGAAPAAQAAPPAWGTPPAAESSAPPAWQPAAEDVAAAPALAATGGPGF